MNDETLMEEETIFVEENWVSQMLFGKMCNRHQKFFQLSFQS